MTEQEKLDLVTNYFAEDWAIDKAMQLLEDYENAEQPAPSAASKAVLAAIRAANMQLVQTGDDEFMLVKYKNAEAQCDGGKCGIGGYCEQCPAARAPADSVLEDAARLERERICAEIKAEDDYCVDQGDYMLDSDDCIKIVRGEWVRPDFAIDAARKQGVSHD